MPAIRRAVPNENWEIVLEFDGPGFKLFLASIAREERGYPFLALPHKLKDLDYDAAAVYWGRTVRWTWGISTAVRGL